MKQGTIKTLGVTALGAAFAVAGSGAASAAGLPGAVEGASGSVIEAPAMQQVFGQDGAVGQLTKGQGALPTTRANGENRPSTLGNLSSENATALLGGVPVVNQVTANSAAPGAA